MSSKDNQASLESLNDLGESNKSKTLRFKENPEENANIFSIMTYRFMNPLMSVGVKKPLEFEDLYPIRKSVKADVQLDNFEAIWKDGKLDDDKSNKNNNDNSNDKNNEKDKKPKTRSLFWTLNSQFGRAYHSSFIFKFLGDACEFVYPFMTYKLTNFVQDPTEPYWHGLIYSGILLLAYLFNSIFICHWEYRAYTVAFNVRSTLIGAIYKKSLLISNSVREKENKGKGNTINLVAMDVDWVEELYKNFQYILAVPLQIIVTCILLFRLLKWSALIGFGSLVLFVPLNFLSAMKQAQIADVVMKKRDVRTSQVTEAINSIRVLKFYGWINLMYEKIMELRSNEVKEIKKLNIYTAFLYLFWFLLPDFVTVTTFCSYALFGNKLEMSTIIASLTLFFIVRFPLSLLPHIFAGLSLSMVSMKRIESFLLNEELEKPKTTLSGSTFYGQVDPDFESQDLAVSINNASFQWSYLEEEEEKEKENGEGKEKDEKEDKKEKKDKKQTKKNEKQPLLINDLDEPLNDGIEDDSIASSSASPSSSKDKEKEQEEEDPVVLQNINLDIQNGTLTVVIGPVGSGKSSLLSAILGDMKLLNGSCALRGSIAYVSQLPWIMNGTLRENILFGMEYDEEKYQRVLRDCELLTDLELLPKGDLSVIGEKGINLSGGQKQRVCIARSIYHDSDLYLLDDPLAALDINVAQQVFKNAILPLIPNKTVILVSHQMYPLEFSDKIVSMKDGSIDNICKYDEISKETWEVYQFQNQSAQKDKDEKGAANEPVTADEKEGDEDDDLIVDEDRNTGKVSYRQYLAYFSKIGAAYMIVSTILGLMSPSLSAFGNYWLTRWSEEWNLPNHQSLLYYLGIYFLSSIFMSFSVFGVTLANTFGGLKASQQFHKIALTKVLNSPIQFFDQNLSGRIINRFSKDIVNLDGNLPICMGDARDALLNVFSVIVMISIASPIVLVLLIPILITFYFIQKYYLNNARELQRLKSLSLSPVITHFSETLTGQNVIRAFGARERFLFSMFEKIDTSTKCNLYEEFVGQWAFFRLGMVCTLFVAGASLSATFLRGHINPALIGLALSYSITLSGELNWTFIQLSNVETQMNSVERIQSYCNLETERMSSKLISKSWPQRGRVVFKNYSMRYRPELPPSLNNIDLSIEPGTKIGICGRTGAGKSSLLLALFRLVEADSGQIEIDGENIGDLNLQDLRSKMSIIPQDPVLFAGTLRYNLDPFDSATDYEIWEILGRVHLRDKIKSLDCLVTEDGGNYSVGQRQLMCLARALLRKSKIIALDEATAAVDLETDAIIQKTIREEFKDSTVITIAHRLNTIIDYDTVVIMSEGRVKSVGKPSDLIELVDNNTSINPSQTNNLNQPPLKLSSSNLNNDQSLI